MAADDVPDPTDNEIGDENDCIMCDGGEGEVETDYGLVCGECADMIDEEMGLTR